MPTRSGRQRAPFICLRIRRVRSCLSRHRWRPVGIPRRHSRTNRGTSRRIARVRRSSPCAPSIHGRFAARVSVAVSRSSFDHHSRSVSVAIAMPALVSFSRANVGPKSRCFFCPKNATTFLATPSLVALHDTLPFNLWTTPIFPSLSTERLRFCACLTFNPRRMDASLLVISPSRQERMTSYLSCSEAVSLISSTAYVC